MPEAWYLPDSVAVSPEPTESLLDAALRAGIPHAHACGGTGVCSTCRIIVVDNLDKCSDRTRREAQVAQRLQFPATMRLACQTTIDGPVTVRRLVLDADEIQFTDAREHDRPVPVGQEREVAVLFADIRDFTPLAETLLPYDVIYVLRQIFAEAHEIITSHRGWVTSYMGDGLMAVFGVDEPASGPIDAVGAGLAMLAAVDASATRFEQLYQRSITLNVGVHCGRAIVGSIGGWATPAPLTAVGDVVNTASRIEQANKETGTKMLISDETLALVDEGVVAGGRFSVRLAGKQAEQHVVEVTGLVG